ncbi:MAG: FAD-binding oxidoreductase [Alphaproteobacteria bacterium]|nr:FAD-binding oxidoreductase [Alphaproteobacteria bacterium]
MSSLTGWGRYPVIEGEAVAGERLLPLTEGAVLSRGLGRAYGDAALPPAHVGRRVVRTPLADRVLAFDEGTGLLRAEAGLSLGEILHVFGPRRWFSPVSTGTQYVTLGGMVASDVHGKNHHVAGTFGAHVRSLRLRIGTGDVVDCSPTVLPDLFWATVGGMGLTGHILEVEVQLARLPTPWIYEETERFGSLREVFDHLVASSHAWPMTVSWVDTSVRGGALGRGILNRGRWAEPGEAPRVPPQWRRAPAVPDVFPGFVMNPFTVRWMNAGYYAIHGAAGKRHVINPEGFFYQLDLLREWNRGYGKKGFTQYQCVLPKDPALYEDFLRLFQNLGGCSFVTVFKDCGNEGEGLLSFPKYGTTLAVDIPMSSRVPGMVRELNAFVIDHGGRVYLAKDAFTTGPELRAMYPKLDTFLEVRERYDPDRRISSALGVRLFGW